ncbi:hypothetical protein [Pseudobacteroides cellulosolvens]|uniref:Uncharacterized protein n=1 Tax=Pseudobacteroides cellulosolvens ATCC 35603 = DSM 2933 TaxID=398512 RepID=A0A0L6JWW3_9FIRM|nr:hypothetical protein [Pseudobacteroides cellulosolvens]KNY30338.1 hypothetical protein Bccel_5618 [Pseudobacteroides cellulosolvens ATCC 35603 = DSM 2933]
MMQTLDEIINEYSRSLFVKYIENGVIIGSVRGYIDENDTKNRCFYSKLGYVDTSFREVNNVSLVFMSKDNK